MQRLLTADFILAMAVPPSGWSFGITPWVLLSNHLFYRPHSGENIKLQKSNKRYKIWYGARRWNSDRTVLRDEGKKGKVQPGRQCEKSIFRRVRGIVRELPGDKDRAQGQIWKPRWLAEFLCVEHRAPCSRGSSSLSSSHVGLFSSICRSYLRRKEGATEWQSNTFIFWKRTPVLSSGKKEGEGQEEKDAK